MTKFNFLLYQIKGQDVKAVLTILQTARSKLIQVKFLKRDNCKESFIGFFFSNSNGNYLMEKLQMRLMKRKIMYDIYIH